MTDTFERGDQVVYLPTKELFDFGYYNQFGDCVIYVPGECNMQDATVAKPEQLMKVTQGRV